MGMTMSLGQSTQRDGSGASLTGSTRPSQTSTPAVTNVVVTPLMTLPTRLRKAMLTAHATMSVGWLDIMLALAFVALASYQAPTVRGVHAPAGRGVSLVSGVEIRTCLTAG